MNAKSFFIGFLVFLLSACTTQPVVTENTNASQVASELNSSQVDSNNLAAFAAEAAVDPCDQIRAASTWETTNLYDLTYQCIPHGWEAFFNDPAINAEVKKISNKLQAEIQAGNEINPAIGDTFRAFYVVSPSNIKAVIVGQDPAPTKGQATGLAFSLKPGTPANKVASVQRVILEAMNEGYSMNLNDGDLSSWATNGTLLLNTALTIPCKKEASSCKIAGHLTLWKSFSTKLIVNINQQNIPLSYILWGSKAAQLSSKITNPLHRVIKGGHPSPLAPANQFFCKNYFNCANKWLENHGVTKVDWSEAGGSTTPSPCIWSKGNNPVCASSCTLSVCN